MSASRMVHLQAVSAISALVIVAIGCGGSSDSNTLSDGGGGSSGSSASGSSSGSGSAAGDDSSTPAGDDDSGLPTMVDDGGIVVPPDEDGGTPTNRDDGGPGVTTPPKGTDGGADQVACGGKSCDSATQVCCVTRTGEECTSAAGCKGDTLACTGSNSCPTAGDVCCEEAVAGPGNAVTSKCETKCPMGAIQLCTTNNDCPAEDICRRLGTTVSVCERAPVTPTRDAGFPMFDGGFARPDGGFPTPGH